MYVLICFALETTDATNDNQICQIACISRDKLLMMHIFFQPVVFPLILVNDDVDSSWQCVIV